MNKGRTSLAVLIAPEFEVLGSFSTGTSCVIAEILSRQTPADNQNMQVITYISAQYGHEQLGINNIFQNMRATSDIKDLRKEWSQYIEAVEDSMSTEREQLEE